MMVISDDLKTDKNRFGDIYFSYFDNECDHQNVLEIGIREGDGLRYLQRLSDEFHLGKSFYGIDIERPPNPFGIKFEIIDQTDLPLLSNYSNRVCRDGQWDFIIDDASHIGEKTSTTFWHMFRNHLKPGGFYFIEDWGCGYWDDWPDGNSSEDSGMVILAKGFIDEIGAIDKSRKTMGEKPARESLFESITYYPGMIVIQKRNE